MTSFRPATVGELPAILALWTEAEAEPTRTDDTASLARLIAHDPGAIIVAEENERIIGSIIAGWDGWRGSLYRLAVAPGHRRHGVGRRLVSEAATRLASLGALRLQAIVVASDAEATEFWRTSGWEEQVERLRFVKG